LQYNDGVTRLTIRPFALCVLLVTLTAATFSGAFRGTFQYDDLFAILINPHLDRWQTFIGHLDHMVRPVLHGTFLLDRFLYENSPAGYHLLNLLLHLGSGCLVYRILTLAITDETRFVPFWTALLFLIHPLQTETVTYISGRASGLMAFLYLLGFFFFIKASAQENNHIGGRFYLSGAIASFLLSLGSKETAVTFPLVLLLWDALIRRLDGAALRKTFLSNHLPFWVIVLVMAAWAWWHPRYRELAQFSLDIRPYWDNLLSQAHATVHALILFFCPWKQNFDHDLPEFHSPFQWPLSLDLLILGGMAAALMIAARYFPLITFGVGWFFIQLLPTTLIPRNDLLSERNLYLASFGLMLAIVALGTRLVQGLTTVLPQPRIVRVTASSLALAVILGLCFMTFQRNVIYRDPVLLWSDTVKKSPLKARPRNNLGHAYALRDDWERAIEEFRIAVQLDPDYAFAKKNLRDAYLHQVGRL
jgi:protein O-mannosyl-transferase